MPGRTKNKTAQMPSQPNVRPARRLTPACAPCPCSLPFLGALLCRHDVHSCVKRLARALASPAAGAFPTPLRPQGAGHSGERYMLRHLGAAHIRSVWMAVACFLAPAPPIPRNENARSRGPTTRTLYTPGTRSFPRTLLCASPGPWRANGRGEERSGALQLAPLRTVVLRASL